MDELIVNALLNWRINIVIIVLSVFVYAFNYFILKLKKEYKGLHSQMFLISLLPGLNLIFLMFNLVLCFTYGAGYRVVKPKKRKVKSKRRAARA